MNCIRKGRLVVSFLKTEHACARLILSLLIIIMENCLHKIEYRSLLIWSLKLITEKLVPKDVIRMVLFGIKLIQVSSPGLNSK